MTRHVLVNLLWCVPGAVGGSEEYLVRQLRGLVDHDAGHRWRISAATARGLTAAHPEFADAVATIEPSFRSDARWRRVVGEATWLRRHLDDVDLVHHGGGTAPWSDHGVPFVVTVHDLQFRTFPEYFSPLKRAYLRAAVPRAVAQARCVAVPSDYVRRTVVAAYGVADTKVLVVPHGVDRAELADAASPEDLRRRYGLGDGPIVVYPAVTHPHKNHRLLLDLMRTRWTDPDLRLVLIGGRGDAHSIVESCADRRVRHLGRVSAADRNGLLSMASAMVFPSTYEGFGAPLLEAMVLGTPVVCADRAALPEVAGEAAIVVPADIDAWAGVLDEVDRRRDELVTAGHRRSALFTARASGAALGDVYEQALS